MTYAELLERGSMNEITEMLLDMLEHELPKYRFKGFANEYVRDALIQMFERGQYHQTQLQAQRERDDTGKDVMRTIN